MEQTAITETQLWQWMMEGNYPDIIDEMGAWEANKAGIEKLHRRAHVTLSCDVKYTETVEQKRKVITPAMRRKGNITREREVARVLPKGSRVNVVMASRMGDVGITPNLDAEYGYVVRINCIEGEWDMFGDGEHLIPLKPEGVLIDIEPIEDPREDKVQLAFPGGTKAPQDYRETS